jgi:hypothetical protein
VFRGLLHIAVTDFAVWEDSHVLEPRSHWQSLIESDPDEGADFPQARVVPDSGGHLCCRRVAKVEFLDEGVHGRRVR